MTTTNTRERLIGRIRIGPGERTIPVFTDAGTSPHNDEWLIGEAQQAVDDAGKQADQRIAGISARKDALK